MGGLEPRDPDSTPTTLHLVALADALCELDNALDELRRRLGPAVRQPEQPRHTDVSKAEASKTPRSLLVSTLATQAAHVKDMTHKVDDILNRLEL